MDISSVEQLQNLSQTMIVEAQVKELELVTDLIDVAYSTALSANPMVGSLVDLVA